MKHTITIFLLALLSIAAHAQKNLPAFGKADKADLEMTDCDFDKGAAAERLFDWGNLYYDRGVPGISFLNTIYEKRERIKILKEGGISYANISIPYYDHNNEEQILKLDACTINLDEAGNIKVTDVSKSSVYTKRINKYFSKMVIAFPDVKVGSIIEYKYKMERRTDQNMKTWYFQEKIPTRYSEYQINVPMIYDFSTNPTVFDHIDVTADTKEDIIATNEGSLSTTVLKKNFVMRNLIGLRDEPFMGSPRDYQQRIEFQLSRINYGDSKIVDVRTSWSDVIKSLMKDDDFGKQLEWAPTQANGMLQEAEQYTDPESKMKFIYNTLRKSMTWDEDESIYSLNGISNTFTKKTGSSGDINLLLVVLLNKAGVHAAPILVSTRENGLINKFNPFITQFNTVMAYVNLGTKYYVLDATDKVSNYKLTPESIVNTQGFIVEGEDGKWLEIIDNKHKYKVMAAIRGEVDDNGTMKGDALVNCYDYARKQHSETWIKNKDDFKKEYFTQPFTAVKIDGLEVNNLDADSLPLEQKAKFITALNSSGEYKYFTTNLFSDLDKNPFVADERTADVDFGFLQDYTLFGNYTIPADYAFETLPENISMIMPDTSIIFTRSMQAEDNLLNVRITVEFKRSFYPVSYYAEFKEFYKKLFDKLNEQIVIKKKTTP
ncbi:MAG: DUF3857 domain-containing protein [Bacteroidetes bacterium]|nr:DUF3857 domain-containing protein [Bacteroidota bacterium]